jgi:hypothetical protein
MNRNTWVLATFPALEAPVVRMCRAVTTLDGWMAGRPDLPARIRCIKIDVEGGEARVLTGMAGILRAHSLTILCETSTGSRADEILAAAGFQRQRIEPGASPYGNFLYVRP